MATFIISYDLRKERDYEELYKAIRSFETYARITDSTWAVVTTETTVQVRAFLKKHLDKDDRLFIIKSGVGAAWSNVKCKNEWLKKNL
jgi:hypothetical protein